MDISFGIHIASLGLQLISPNFTYCILLFCFPPGNFPQLLATFTVPFIDMRPWWTNVTVASRPSRVLRLRFRVVGKMTQKCGEKRHFCWKKHRSPRQQNENNHMCVYIYSIFVYITFAPNDSWFWKNCVRVHEKTLWMTQPRVALMSLLSNLLLPTKNSHLKDGGIWRGCSRRVLHPWIDTSLAPLVNFMEESFSNYACV